MSSYMNLANRYFTQLFIHLLQLTLEPKYHDRLLLKSDNTAHVKYIVMRNCIPEVPEGDLYVILAVASSNALSFIGNYTQIFVGKICQNLVLDPKSLYLEWDVVYEK